MPLRASPSAFIALFLNFKRSERLQVLQSAVGADETARFGLAVILDTVAAAARRNLLPLHARFTLVVDPLPRIRAAHAHALYTGGDYVHPLATITYTDACMIDPFNGLCHLCTAPTCNQISFNCLSATISSSSSSRSYVSMQRPQHCIFVHPEPSYEAIMHPEPRARTFQIEEYH